MSIPTTERLALALEEQQRRAYDVRLVEMIAKTRAGWYDDYKSPLATPIVQLVNDLLALGLTTLAQRAMVGEFDASQDEAEAWAKGSEAQELFRRLANGE